MAKTTRYRYFQPETAARLGRLSLVARGAVEGFISGLHKSPHHGFSVEFSEHREYAPGDEIRHLDWQALARTDRYYVKQYEQETNLRAHILLDTSGSMGYGSGGLSKLEYGCYLTASLAYLMVQQQDLVGLVACDKDVRLHIPPGGTASHLNQIFEALEPLTASSETRLSATFHGLAERLHKRGLLIIISDLYDDPDQVMKALQHFRHKKHQIIVFHILDQEEIDFPFTRVANFVDMETDERIQVDPKLVADQYRREMTEFVNRYRRECGDHRIEYVLAMTSLPHDLMLRAYLARRRHVT